jgi:hypothetical protein
MTGTEKHLQRLGRIRGPRMIEQVTRALYGGAVDIQIAAQISITEGAVSGKNHVASAPGTPPNNDTGVLANNIEAAITAPLKAEASSNAPYAVAQEKGSEKLHLPERPYMAPAAKRMRSKVRGRVVRAVDKVCRSG